MGELRDYEKEAADNPEWHLTTRVHDWRNHVPEDVRVMWKSFSQPQRYALYAWAEELAGREHWD